MLSGEQLPNKGPINPGRQTSNVSSDIPKLSRVPHSQRRNDVCSKPRGFGCSKVVIAFPFLIIIPLLLHSVTASRH
ncbi:hypothetical protein JOC94_001251 [Bacillus thermophilus]|uniref:Transmembrane protein n=1 Tax=Siminovitchia thermophila TaxID=1245522 RepID=A0ABS2R537_9BACI|nr:hypothetical protein [Siminovitchia thermophila]